jgi:ADP-L-glycero-D-manno-heptose 6-epimerase
MTLHFLEKDSSGLFNVGSGKMQTWNQLADAIFKALDLPRNVEFIDMPEHLRDRYQYRTEADLTRLRDTGYADEPTTLDAAVADYVRNYLIPGKHLGD